MLGYINKMIALIFSPDYDVYSVLKKFFTLVLL